MPPKKTSVIVFDIDGTLTDSVAPHQAAFEAALRSFPFPALRTDWASYKHHSDSAIVQEAWEEAGFDGHPDMDGVEAQYRLALDNTICAHPILEIPGSSAFLSALEQTQWVACFATGSFRYGALRKLDALACPVDLDLLVTASEYQTREDIVAASIESARSRHSISDLDRVLSVGDGLWDLFTARNLGLEFLGVGGDRKADQLRAQDARVVADLAAGLELLDDLN
ncbi:HAD family hydrolase [Rhodovulum sp. P5]|uniref:HAD family hydrolase n=1 Tax=Rhodovulum sp. P5 TaxID=1564506 RepID=UPI0009DB5743|nr:HAD family hydrolase [Rhodovulum sp. P5]